MLTHFHFPQYFSQNVRQEIGELYASSAIRNMAVSMMLLFEPIYLYSVLGLSVPQVLSFMAVTYAVYIVFIGWGGKLASLYGYKHTIAIGAPFLVFYWLTLLLAKDNPGLTYLPAIILGLEKSLYWPAYHALMSRYADRGQVGREFGVMYAIISVSHIVGPFLAGWLASTYGFVATFVLASMLQCMSIFPLFKAKEVFIPKPYQYRDTWNLYRTQTRKFFGYMGFGEELLVLVVWPIYIYWVVQDYAGTGFIATVSSLLAGIMAIFIGRITDQYAKKVLIKIGSFFSSLVWLARLVTPTAWTLLGIDTLSRASKELAFIPISTVTYIKAEETHVVPQVVFFEQSLAVGKLLACLLGMLLFSLTGSFVVLFILGALFSILYMLV